MREKSAAGPPAADFLIFVAQDLLVCTIFQANIPHEQRDLVLWMQSLPQLIGQGLRVRERQSRAHRLALKGGQGSAVPLIGVEEAALAGKGIVIEIEVAQAAAGVPIGTFQDGELKTAVRGEKTGDSGRIVGCVWFKLPAAQGLGKGAARQEIVPDRVGLITVCDHQPPTHLPDGMVDDQTGVCHPGGVVSLGTDAVLCLHENPVSGVFASAHDEIGRHGALTVGCNLTKAFFVMEEVEFSAKIAFMAQQLGNQNELTCDELAKLMELRVKMQIPGKHPGCKKCPNLGTENCKCKQNLPAGTSASCSCGSAAPADVSDDLVAEITRKVLAELKK